MPPDVSARRLLVPTALAVRSRPSDRDSLSHDLVSHLHAISLMLEPPLLRRLLPRPVPRGPEGDAREMPVLREKANRLADPAVRLGVLDARHDTRLAELDQRLALDRVGRCVLIRLQGVKR